MNALACSPRTTSFEEQCARATSVAALLVCSCIGGPALAAGAQSDGGRDIEEVIVTSQRRSERLQDVPISITAVGGEALDRSSVRSVAEALNTVPGVATATSATNARSGNRPSVIIRGVAPTTGSSTVAYYLDSIPFGAFGSLAYASIAPDPSPYDLDRVEVMRGPQGTLYGLSASNGVVRVLTKDADLREFELKARGSMAGTKDGAMSYRADAALNAPLVEDKLAVRIVAGYQDSGGWIDRTNEDDANSSQSSNARLKVNAKPTENFSVGLLAWRSETDVDASPVSPDGRHSSFTLDTPAFEDFDAYGLKLAYDTSVASITSTTSYLDYSLQAFIDFGVINLPNIIVENTSELEVWSQEVVVNSTHEGPLRWTIGGIYRSGEVESLAVRRNALTGGFGAPNLAPNIQRNDSDSLAFFGEATLALFDGKLELTGGLRYFEEEIEATELSSSTAVGGIPPGGLLTSGDKFDSVTPRAVVSWHPNGDSTIYASYGEGFRSGVTQAFSTLRQAPGFGATESDLLKNYEVGVKASVWDGRLNFEAAAFYIDWEDVLSSLQVVVTQTPLFLVTGVVNAAEASGPGAEAALSVQPVDGLTMSASVGWNDLKYAEDVFNASGVRVIFADERLTGSPEWTAGAAVQYVFDIGGNGWQGRLGASANYLSKIISARNAARVPLTGDSMFVAGASFAVESGGGPAAINNWTATLFVENLTDENPILVRDQFSPEWNSGMRPLTVGLQLDFKF